MKLSIPKLILIEAKMTSTKPVITTNNLPKHLRLTKLEVRLMISLLSPHSYMGNSHYRIYSYIFLNPLLSDASVIILLGENTLD